MKLKGQTHQFRTLHQPTPKTLLSLSENSIFIHRGCPYTVVSQSRSSCWPGSLLWDGVGCYFTEHTYSLERHGVQRAMFVLSTIIIVIIVVRTCLKPSHPFSSFFANTTNPGSKRRISVCSQSPDSNPQQLKYRRLHQIEKIHIQGQLGH